MSGSRSLSLAICGRLSISLMAICLTTISLAASPAKADEAKFKAILLEYFLAEQKAIPLFINHNVVSGDVLQLGDEQVRVSRRVCYNLDAPSYRRVEKQISANSFAFDGLLGGSATVDEIAKLALEVKGDISKSVSVTLDPLSREQPPQGTYVLGQPKAIDDCAPIRQIFGGVNDSIIVVAAVLHGVVKAVSSLELKGGVSGSAEISNEQLKDLIEKYIGKTPEVTGEVNGSRVTLDIALAPQPMSLAAQAYLIQPTRLAQLYVKYAKSEGEIRQLLHQYYEETDPSSLSKIRHALHDSLQEIGLYYEGWVLLIRSIFGGEGAKPLDEETLNSIPQEQWNALADVAAANEIAAQ